MSFHLRLEETETRKVDAFPSHEFRHKFFLVDENEQPTSKEWLSGDRFDWVEQLRPAKPDSDWYTFQKDIETLIEDAINFRVKEIPRLQGKEESLGAKIKELGFHLEVRKKDLSQQVTRNVKNTSAYYMMRDYEAKFTLLHGLAQLAQVQGQVIDLITACVIRRVQARMRWLLPLFCKVWADQPDADGPLVGNFEIFVWHPYTDHEGTILEEMLEPDSLRDYPMILQQLMPPEKMKTLLKERQQKAMNAKTNNIMVAGEDDMRKMEDFKKKFGDQLGGK